MNAVPESWGRGQEDFQQPKALERNDSATKVTLVRKMPLVFLTVADPRGRQLALICIKTLR